MTRAIRHIGGISLDYTKQGTTDGLKLRSDRVELTMPARESMLMLVRLTVSGMLAHRVSNFDMLEDLKAAAAEACYCIIQQPCGYERMSLCFILDSDSMMFCVHGMDATMQAEKLESMEKCQDVALCILESMVDKAQVHTEAGVITGFTLIKSVN